MGLLATLHRRLVSLSLVPLGPRFPRTQPLAPPVESGLGDPHFTQRMGPSQGTFSLYSTLWAGNCCLRHPFSPVLEPRQGGDSCYSGWVNLAPRNYSSNNVLLAVQAWGTPSAWRHVPRPPIRWVFIRSVGLSEPCQYIPCPLLPNNTVLCRFLRAITLIDILA